ncbi:hypothetical protein PP175_28615 (plasmid) [Aneurinibacillus sp. Ricciae_BoGa-3]|uniref:hypothetical protein n=1 Tax=Aneurinibacillus sp. Ricciae_BoGa-3 TaxID=3022697 RepID=UPI002341B001|nr:hypothetical protein [Aneurinibacillus sp. Ricciae_BoGa-3]WCK57153.1 hypothetical protein PP175_28615 [Aneurinibacillus sp. Ricciae_BoGa-3]
MIPNDMELKDEANSGVLSDMDYHEKVFSDYLDKHVSIRKINDVIWFVFDTGRNRYQTPYKVLKQLLFDLKCKALEQKEEVEIREKVLRDFLIQFDVIKPAYNDFVTITVQERSFRGTSVATLFGHLLILKAQFDMGLENPSHGEGFTSEQTK